LLTAARLTLAALLATVALAATACGGGSDGVPASAVAVVNGTEISKEQLTEIVDRAKKGYEAQKQQFPKAGTPEYQNVQRQYLADLVQIEELRQSADELGVEVTKNDIDALENEVIKSSFKGDRAEYEKALEEAGWTPEQYRRLGYEVSALRTEVFEAVTKDVKVTDDELRAYYAQNQSQYGTPESRDVRHILIAEKDKDGNVDFAASKARADEIYAELKGGADFASLAKTNSQDPGSKDSGGKLTISRGQTVPEFDKVSFELDKGELSKPVKTTYGYHVIEPVSEIRKANLTPFAKVKATISTELLQARRNEVMQAWLEDLTKDYEGKVSYAAGYEPPELPEAPTESQ
jgi:parvulin-like peptidyl-prolyl isomerase